MDIEYSVIVPVYNVRQYLAQCLDSILAQSCGDFELLLADDGSTDGSGALCDEYAQKDPRVRALHLPNLGVVAARGAALDAARGAYVCFVDGDDWVRSNWLETVNACITENGRPDILIFDYATDDGSPGQSPLAAPGLYDRARLEREVYPYMLWDRRRPFFSQLIPGHQCTKVIRRELLLAHWMRGASVAIYEDVAMFYECLYHARSLYVCPEALYVYRQRSDSALHQFDPQALRQLKLCRDYLWAHLVRQTPALAPQAEAFVANKILRAFLHECRYGGSLRDSVARLAADLDETGLARDLSGRELPGYVRLFLAMLRRRAYYPAMLVYRLRLWVFDRFQAGR